jgi:hypothetical protein
MSETVEKTYEEKVAASKMWRPALGNRFANVLWNQGITSMDELRAAMDSGAHRRWSNCGPAAEAAFTALLGVEGGKHESRAWSPKATPNTRLLTEQWLWERLRNHEPLPVTPRDVRVLLEEIERLRKVVRQLEEAAGVKEPS